MLPDSNKDAVGSQGFVAYKIQPYSNLPEATAIVNTAYIFFDFNPAVVTNTTLNTISYFISVPENNNALKDVSVYPNPAKAELFVRFNELPADANITIFDMLGKKILFQPVKSATTRIISSSISEGVYFMQVQNPISSSVFKVVIASE